MFVTRIRKNRLGTAETHTIQTLLLKLIGQEETVFRGQNIGIKLLQEALTEARASREVAFEELVEKPLMARGKSKETMSNLTCEVPLVGLGLYRRRLTPSK